MICCLHCPRIYIEERNLESSFFTFSPISVYVYELRSNFYVNLLLKNPRLTNKHLNELKILTFVVRKEIPVRLAHIITQLPHYFHQDVYHQRSAQFVQDYFEMSFKEIESLPQSIQTIDSNFETQLLEVFNRFMVAYRIFFIVFRND